MAEYVGAVHIRVKDKSVWQRFGTIDEERLESMGLTEVNTDCCYYSDYGDYLYFQAFYDFTGTAEKVAKILGKDGIFVFMSTNIDVDPYIEYYCYFGDSVRHGYKGDVDFDEYIPNDIDSWLKKLKINLNEKEQKQIMEYYPKYTEKNETKKQTIKVSNLSKYNLNLFGSVVEAEGIHEFDEEQSVVVAYKIDTEVAKKFSPGSFLEYTKNNGKEFTGVTLIINISCYDSEDGLPWHCPYFLLLDQYSEDWDTDPDWMSKVYDFDDYQYEGVGKLRVEAVETFFQEEYGIFIDEYLEEKYGGDGLHYIF